MHMHEMCCTCTLTYYCTFLKCTLAIIARFGKDGGVQVVIAQKSLFIVYHSPGDHDSK